MKLKTKLSISFCCIILIPIVLFLLTAVATVKYQLISIRYEYGVNATAMDLMPSNARIYEHMAERITNQIREKIEYSPFIMEDRSAMQQYCDELSAGGVNLFVLKGDEIYCASGDMESEEADGLYRLLTEEAQEDTLNYYMGKYVRIFNIYESTFKDGSDARIIAVVYQNEWLPQLKALIFQSFLAIIFILMLTASCFTLWIYRSIVRPINVLKEGANKIKDGDLNFKITGSEKDELGELCTAFEEMRQRLKEITEERMQYDIESKELISNISHDLKTPITAIKGYVEGIQDGVADTKEKQARYLKTIYSKAVDMDRLIDELTFYSKIDTNRIPYNFKKISSRAYFADCADEVGTELQSQNIDFHYADFVEDDTQIIADPEQLRRVINNIISNSVKYFDKERCYINMRIRDVGDFIQVEIEDNGKGIAKKDIPYIFDRFYRTDSSRNSSKGGSGIGLSIVKKILEDHGGKIWANSREGTGTSMYFVLRKAPDEKNEIGQDKTLEGKKNPERSEAVSRNKGKE